MFETFSFLPPLTDGEISRQVDYIVRNGWSEFCRRQRDSRGQAAATRLLARRSPVGASSPGCHRGLQPAVQPAAGFRGVQQGLWLPASLHSLRFFELLRQPLPRLALPAAPPF